jgi:hypothetical protein
MKRATVAVLVLLMVAAAFAEVQRYHVAIDDSPQRGPKDAPVTVIEFLDFQ